MNRCLLKLYPFSFDQILSSYRLPPPLTCSIRSLDLPWGGGGGGVHVLERVMGGLKLFRSHFLNFLSAPGRLFKFFVSSSPIFKFYPFYNAGQNAKRVDLD